MIFTIILTFVAMTISALLSDSIFYDQNPWGIASLSEPEKHSVLIYTLESALKKQADLGIFSQQVVFLKDRLSLKPAQGDTNPQLALPPIKEPLTMHFNIELKNDFTITKASEKLEKYFSKYFQKREKDFTKTELVTFLFAVTSLDQRFKRTGSDAELFLLRYLMFIKPLDYFTGAEIWDGISPKERKELEALMRNDKSWSQLAKYAAKLFTNNQKSYLRTQFRYLDAQKAIEADDSKERKQRDRLSQFLPLFSAKPRAPENDFKDLANAFHDIAENALDLKDEGKNNDASIFSELPLLEIDLANSDKKSSAAFAATKLGGFSEVQLDFVIDDDEEAAENSFSENLTTLLAPKFNHVESGKNTLLKSSEARAPGAHLPFINDVKIERPKTAEPARSSQMADSTKNLNGKRQRKRVEKDVEDSVLKIAPDESGVKFISESDQRKMNRADAIDQIPINPLDKALITKTGQPLRSQQVGVAPDSDSGDFKISDSLNKSIRKIPYFQRKPNLLTKSPSENVLNKGLAERNEVPKKVRKIDPLKVFQPSKKKFVRPKLDRLKKSYSQADLAQVEKAPKLKHKLKYAFIDKVVTEANKNIDIFSPFIQPATVNNAFFTNSIDNAASFNSNQIDSSKARLREEKSKAILII